MNLLLITIITLITLLILYQVYGIIKSKRTVGNIIPFDKINFEIASMIKNIKSLLYFYLPDYNNYNTQTPVIEKLKNEFESIVSVNTTKHFETVRAFYVMGTPSLMFLGLNRIEGFYVGVKNKAFIKEKLQNI